MPGEQVSDGSPQAEKKKTSPWVGPIIFIITLVILFAGLELIAYIWEARTAQDHLGWTLVAARRLKYERRGSEESPYYLLTPGETYNYEGNPVAINDSGLRGPDVQRPKPPGTIRILNLGDSIAFGWEVNYEDTYGAQLADLLAENGIDVEVVNAAAPGWNLESERNYLIQEGLSYEPNLVILDFTLVNDVGGGGPALTENPSVKDWLRDHTYFWPFLTIQARFLMARQRGPEAIPVLNPPSEAEGYFPTDYNSQVWDTVWGYIDEMATTTEVRDIPFIVVVFPTALQVNSANHSNVPQQVLADRALTAGIPLVDLLPVYKEYCEQAEPDACEGYENALFADVWMHPRTNGHLLAAQALLPEVLSALSQ